jgi:hypothetical protein
MNLNPSDLGGAAAGLNGKTKINMNAMQSQLNRNMKMGFMFVERRKNLVQRKQIIHHVGVCVDDGARELRLDAVLQNRTLVTIENTHLSI